MKKPPIPRINFPDPVKHVSKKELLKRIRKVLFALRDKVKNKQMLVQFAGASAPGYLPNDTQRLPYISETGKAKQSSKEECLAAKISWLIQKYWQYCTTDESQEKIIEKCLEELEQIVVKGLKNYAVKGDMKKGFWI